MSGCFLVSLDSTIVATACPRIVSDLGDPDWYSWIAGGYLLGSAVIMPLAGRLIDLMNGRRVLMVATLVFLVASALCAAAKSLPVLVAWRVVQGVGGGAMMAVTLGLVGLLYAPTERGTVTALYGVVLGVSSVLGPLLGGLLTDHLSWHWVFLVNLPIGAFSLDFLRRGMPDLVPEGQGRLDMLGSALLLCASVPLLLALSGEGASHPLATVRGQMLVGGALVASVLFVAVERRVESPLFDLALLGNRVFTQATIASATASGAYIGAVLFLPLYLVKARGMSATWSGMALTPVVLGLVVGSTLVGQALRRIRRCRPVLVLGGLLALPALVVLRAQLADQPSFTFIVTAMVVIGFSFGLMMTTFPIAVQGAVERARMGTATSFMQFIRTMGQTAALCLMGSLISDGDAAALVSGMRAVFTCSIVLVGVGLVLVLPMPDPELGER